MSKKIINALKSEVKKLEYADLKPTSKRTGKLNNTNSGHDTYIDLNRSHNLTINKQKITNGFIDQLYSQHKNLILGDENEEKNYRPFLKKVFTEMFEHAGATVPNDLIIGQYVVLYYCQK